MVLSFMLGCSGDFVSRPSNGPYVACYGLLWGLIGNRLTESTDHPSGELRAVYEDMEGPWHGSLRSASYYMGSDIGSWKPPMCCHLLRFLL